MDRIIDVHSHFVPEEYVRALKEKGKELEDGFPTPLWCLKEHLEFMEMSGIERSLISLSSPHQHMGERKEAAYLTRKINEIAADLKIKYPEKFLITASLPLPEIEDSIKEAIFAFDQLNTDAIKISSNSIGLYPGDQKLDPLFEYLNEKNAVIVIHPTKPQMIPENCFTSSLLPLMEFIADTTRAVINMIANETIIKYPNIKVVIPHNGSFIPAIIDRLEGILRVLAQKGVVKEIDIKANFRNFYFDTAGDMFPRAFDSLMTITDYNHVMFGGDYPYTPAFMIKERVEQLKAYEKSQAFLDKILYENATKLFKI